jgi:hypothetical protein
MTVASHTTTCPDLPADAVQITKISPSLNHILPPGSALLWLATLAIIEALIFTYWAILTLPIVRPHTQHIKPISLCGSSLAHRSLADVRSSCRLSSSSVSSRRMPGKSR